ncbi:MAG: DUF6484 domain-containing protein [Nitrospira sp.]
MERRQSEQVLELLVEQSLSQDSHPATQPAILNGVHRGVLSEIDLASGAIKVVVPAVFGMEPVVARSLVPLSQDKLGEEVLIAFEMGEPRSPYIIGALWQPEQPPVGTQSLVQAKVDGEQVVIEGKKEIVLKCGKSSITLTRAGKVLIRGAYVLSRSSGVNRIKGGSVQVN